MMRRQPPTPSASDFGPEIINPNTGEIRYALSIVVEEIALGTRATVKRARRADPLAGIEGVTQAMRTAAAIYAQACEHVQAGRSMGPMPWAADRVGSDRNAGLLAQERALSAAEWRRRGKAAMGADGEHVVMCVCVDGLSLAAYDALRQWRKGGGRTVLLAGLTVLAEEYGC